MRASHWLTGPLFLCWLTLIFACENGVSTSLEGKACDTSFSCVSGYACDMSSKLCVREGTESSTCEVGETSCNGTCTRLASDPANCGGCAATCTSPAHGAGVCLVGACNFVCTGGYAACGSVCVDFQSDADNCGACGSRCPDPAGRQRHVPRWQMPIELLRAAHRVRQSVQGHEE